MQLMSGLALKIEIIYSGVHCLEGLHCWGPEAHTVLWCQGGVHI